MKVPIFSTEYVATLCKCKPITVLKYAKDNNITFLGGENKRKTYVWFQEDIDTFKTREKQGRPKKIK